MAMIDAIGATCRLLELGFSVRKTAAVLGVSASSVVRWRAAKRKSSATRRRQVSRKRSEKDRERISVLKKLMSKKTPRGDLQYPSLRLLARGGVELGVPLGAPNTVRRLLHADNFVCKPRPRGVRRRPGDAEKRVAFARQELRLGKVKLATTVFSDEKIFDLSTSTSNYCWVKKGSLAPCREEERWAPKVHVFCAFGNGFRSLVFLDGQITSQAYVDTCLKPNISGLKKYRFQQDGARAHTAANTTRFLKRHKINFIEAWPARSPDMNPCENLWGILARRVALCGPTTVDELKQFIVSEFNSIPSSMIDNLVQSYRSKLLLCLRNKGK
jgi:transposase